MNSNASPQPAKVPNGKSPSKPGKQDKPDPKDDLKTFAQKFAGQHNVQWPFVVDPQGKLTDEVKADYALGENVGLDHTPTIFIVTDGRNSAQQFQEVTDRSKMDAMLQAAIQQVGGVKAAAAATPKPVVHHKAAQ